MTKAQSIWRVLTTCLVLEIFAGATTFASGEEKIDQGADRTWITGVQARACAVAFKEFEQFGYDIVNFTVLIEDEPDTVEVTFVPRATPGSDLRSVGGETSFGSEVHYYVDKTDFRIIKQHFAR